MHDYFNMEFQPTVENIKSLLETEKEFGKECVILLGKRHFNSKRVGGFSKHNIKDTVGWYQAFDKPPPFSLPIFADSEAYFAAKDICLKHIKILQQELWLRFLFDFQSYIKTFSLDSPIQDLSGDRLSGRSKEDLILIDIDWQNYVIEFASGLFQHEADLNLVVAKLAKVS